MNNGFRWAVLVGALLLAAIVGVMAYNYGVAQGVEEGGKWHRPWGFGFFFIPLFFLAFWLLVVSKRAVAHWRNCVPRAERTR